MRGGIQRGSREGGAGDAKHRNEGALATERGAQRACAALAAGALELFAVAPSVTAYDRAAGALELFAVAPLSVVYK